MSQQLRIDAGHGVRPYTAGSTIIRPDLADGEVEIRVNWSVPYPEIAGCTLASIAAECGLTGDYLWADAATAGGFKPLNDPADRLYRAA